MDIKKALDTLGLRDYKDPEARQKAIKDFDLTVKMSLTQALVAISAFDTFRIILSMSKEDVIKHVNNLQQHLEDNPVKDKMSEDMQYLSNETMKEVYRKQREIYAEKNH